MPAAIGKRSENDRKTIEFRWISDEWEQNDLQMGQRVAQRAEKYFKSYFIIVALMRKEFLNQKSV